MVKLTFKNPYFDQERIVGQTMENLYIDFGNLRRGNIDFLGLYKDLKTGEYFTISPKNWAEFSYVELE